MDATTSGGSHRHYFSGAHGKNVVEAFASSAGDGTWRFDFHAAEHFVPGSIRIDNGQVVFRDGYTVVFHVKAGSGERIVFSYELSP